MCEVLIFNENKNFMNCTDPEDGDSKLLRNVGICNVVIYRTQTSSEARAATSSLAPYGLETSLATDAAILWQCGNTRLQQSD